MKKIVATLVSAIIIFSLSPTMAYAHCEYDIKVTKIDDSIAEIYPLFDGMRRFKAQNGLYGYLNEKYEVVIEPIYEYAEDFKNSIACARTPESKVAAGIDKSGEVVWDKFIEFDENGIGIATDGDFKGFVSQDGKSLTEIKYKSLTPFKNGVALAAPDEAYRYTTLIDKNFNEYVLPEGQRFKDVLDSGLIVVRNEASLYGFVDRWMGEVVPCIYQELYTDDMEYYTSEYPSAYARKGGPYKVSYNGIYGYIDKYGEVSIPVIYDSLGQFMPDGLIPSRLNGEYGLINSSGERIYDDYLQYSGDVYLARNNESMWFVDLKDGSSIKVEDIEVVSDYVDGVALAVKTSPFELDGVPDHREVYYGIVDIYGNIIKDFDIRIWDEIHQTGHGGTRYHSYLYRISDSLVAVRIDNKWGYMDLSGNMVIEPQYDMAYVFKYGYAKVELGEETYYIDKLCNRYDNLDIKEVADYYKDYPIKEYSEEKDCYFFYDLVRPSDYDTSQFNNYHLFLDGEYGALKDEDTIILESDGDRIVDAKGNVLVENCIVEPYGEEGEKEHIAMYFTSDKNVLVKTADGNCIIEAEETETPDEIILTIGEKEAVFNGEPCENDVAPIIINERTMLPIRFVAEKLGARVSYIEKTNLVAVTLGDTQIAHIIGSDTAKVNGEEIALDVSSFTKNDRTYLPIRFIMENLGAEVEWLKDTNQVIITSK